MSSAPAVPTSQRPRQATLPALNTSTSSVATRKVLLRIPNAKASRWTESTQSWSFLALGDFVVYQVSQPPPASSSGSSTPRQPPPVPSRSPVGNGNGSSSSTSTAAPALPPRFAGDAGSSSASPSSSSPSASTPVSTRSVSPSNAAGSASSGTSGIVLAVRNTEFPLTSTTNVDFRDENTYILNNGEGFIVAIELETPRSGSHTILDNVLRKYTVFNGVLPTAASTNLGVPENQSNPNSATSSPELRPSDFKGSLLLIDEDTGKILGPLHQSVPTLEAANISSPTSNEKPNEMSSENIVVTFPEGDNAGGQVQISAFDDIKAQYGKSDSKIVGAAEYVSKGMLFAAEYGANYTSSAAKRYTESTKATDTPMVFSQTTKNTAATVAKGTESALKLTRSAVGYIAGKAEQVGSYVANTAGDGLAKAGVPGAKGGGDPNKGVRGFVKNGILALSTVAEGLEKGGKHFLETGRQSTNTVVGHRFGDEARDLTDTITSAGSNVVLVYVDARGVMHRALLKRVGKGALKARMQDGREVVLDDSGLQNQHTERDEKGNLIVVDEKNHQDYTFTNDQEVGGGGTYATGYQSAFGEGSQGLYKRPNPPIPPRMT